MSGVRDRERELIAATRRLFDERGALDAPIEEIARSVGIARGLIYRHFSSKDELYVVTVTDYLHELDELLGLAVDADDPPAVQLELLTEAYAGFCQRYPAFVDSSLSLMRRPARDLHDEVSESVWLRLGQGMGACIDHLASILRRGVEAGEFCLEDPEYMANVLWTQALGVMHLARLRVGLRQAAPGMPELFSVAPDRVVRTCVDIALTAVCAPQPAGDAE